MREHGRKRVVHFARRADRPQSYNDLKAELTMVVAANARRQLPGLVMTHPIRPRFTWYEPDGHRDPDGVSSGGRKIILDGMVAAGILPQDNRRGIAGFGGEEFVYGVPRPGVEVEWSSSITGLYYKLVLEQRLPDLNELLAARELGARRSMRREARK